MSGLEQLHFPNGFAQFFVALRSVLFREADDRDGFAPGVDAVRSFTTSLGQP